MSQLPIASIVRAFRIKELQRVLVELGLTKAGRKADQQLRLNQYLDQLSDAVAGQRERAGPHTCCLPACAAAARLLLPGCCCWNGPCS